MGLRAWRRCSCRTRRARLRALKRGKEAHPKPWISLHTGLQFFSGLAVVPLAMLFVGAFSDPVLQMLIRTNGVVLAGAAAVALLAILENRET
jgi:hypothetical protein